MTADKTKSEDFKNLRGENHSHITGWGIDIDPKNDPTYPMKERTDQEIRGYSWDRPAQQPVDMEVLHSVERPNVSAVFGTAVPPSGLSGKIRRSAFKYSESSYGRWMNLIVADRLNMVEGIIDDLRHGHLPNIWDETGWKAQWKYNKKDFLVQSASVLAVTGLAFFLLARRKKE